MYKIFLTNRAVRDLEKLLVKVRGLIGIKLKEYSQQPLEFARKLTNSKIGSYRFRIGVYRAIFDIEDRKIILLRIGHRKDIYR